MSHDPNSRFSFYFVSFHLMWFISISIQLNYYIYCWFNENEHEHNKNSIFMPIDFKLGNLDDFPFGEILFNQIRKAFVRCHYVRLVNSNEKNDNGMKSIRYIIEALNHILSFVSNQHHNNNHLIMKTKTFYWNDGMAMWNRLNNRKFYLLWWRRDLHNYWTNEKPLKIELNLFPFFFYFFEVYAYFIVEDDLCCMNDFCINLSEGKTFRMSGRE